MISPSDLLRIGPALSDPTLTPQYGSPNNPRNLLYPNEPSFSGPFGFFIPVPPRPYALPPGSIVGGIGGKGSSYAGAGTGVIVPSVLRVPVTEPGINPGVVPSITRGGAFIRPPYNPYVIPGLNIGGAPGPFTGGGGNGGGAPPPPLPPTP